MSAGATAQVSALAYCHERKVFHRGVRAANVLLDAGRRNCKLADFSAAVRTTAVVLTTPSTNELKYQPPEVATGGAYSPAAADARLQVSSGADPL